MAKELFQRLALPLQALLIAALLLGSLGFVGPALISYRDSFVSMLFGPFVVFLAIWAAITMTSWFFESLNNPKGG